MNIFLLHPNPITCAFQMIDKHIVKMPTEHAQMLSTACRLSGLDAGYAITHANHPCSVWARTSIQNYIYLRDLTLAIGDEYRSRYGMNKSHKAVELVKSLPIPNLPNIGLTPFAQAMPIEYQQIDAIEAYRAYYRNDKREIATWKHGVVPEWFVSSPERENSTLL
jgi:hypothetical protein